MTATNPPADRTAEIHARADLTAEEQLADNPSLFADEASDRIRRYLAKFPNMKTVGPETAFDVRSADGSPYALPVIDIVAILDDLDRTNMAFESQTNNWRRARKDRDAALARVEELEGRLATARALHKPVLRYTPDGGETSYDTEAEAAEVYTGTFEPVTTFKVCAHCASIEMGDLPYRDYRESLWPCKDAKALGLGEESVRACDHRQCPPSECRGC